MDRVRFGRALGTGAREAAKALLKAADAATSPDPSPTAPTRRVQVQPPVRAQIATVMATTANVKREGKKLRGAMLAPLAKAGSVLWLEVTGALFGLFAVVIGTWVWAHRADFAGNEVAKQREWGCAAMFALFAYFTVTSYTRAAKRGKR